MRHDYNDAAVAGAMAGMMVFIVIALVIALFMIICLWKIFSKAGKPGWASIIPVYREVVMLEMTGKPMWWIAMIFLVPIANIIYGIKLLDAFVKTFGKTSGFTVGLIFFPIIFLPILAFGDSKYTKPQGAE